MPANVDLATSDAIKISSEVDPTGERTMGVMTKMDLIESPSNGIEIIELLSEFICSRQINLYIYIINKWGIDLKYFIK